MASRTNCDSIRSPVLTVSLRIKGSLSSIIVSAAFPGKKKTSHTVIITEADMRFVKEALSPLYLRYE